MFLSSTDSRAYAIFTLAREYRTAAGVGPCSPVKSLLRVYDSGLRRYPNDRSLPVVAYRLGRLWFSVSPGGIVSGVTLTDLTPSLATLAGAPVCGQSDASKS